MWYYHPSILRRYQVLQGHHNNAATRLGVELREEHLLDWEPDQVAESTEEASRQVLGRGEDSEAERNRE